MKLGLGLHICRLLTELLLSVPQTCRPGMDVWSSPGLRKLKTLTSSLNPEMHSVPSMQSL